MDEFEGWPNERGLRNAYQAVTADSQNMLHSPRGLNIVLEEKLPILEVGTQSIRPR